MCAPGPRQLYFIIPNKTRYFLDHILNHRLSDSVLSYLHILTLISGGRKINGVGFMNPNFVAFKNMKPQTVFKH